MSIVASNPSPKTSHGPLADLPSATASGVNAGDLYITTDTWPSRVYEVRLNASSVREWVNLLTADSIIDMPSTQVDLYVETTGSDTNSGLSVGAALATLDRALLVAGRYETKKVYIHLGAGIFDQPVNTTDSNGSVYLNIPTLAGGVGRANCEPLIVQGTMADAGTGSRVQQASAAGSAPTFTTVTDTAGGLTVSAYKGMWLRYTSGAASGRCFLIVDNTATVITLDAFGATGAANTDTYVIEDCATQIRWLVGGSPAQNITFIGGAAIFDSLQWTFTGGGVNMNVNLQHAGGTFTRSRFKCGDGTTVLSMNARVGGVLNLGWPSSFPSETLYKPRGGAIYAGGVDVVANAGSAITGTLGTLALQSVRIKNCSVFVVGGPCLLNVFHLEASPVQVAGTSAAAATSIVNGRITGTQGPITTVGGVQFRGVIMVNAARVRITAIDISDTTNGEQIVALRGSYVFITGVFSGSNNVAGLQRPIVTSHGGQVQMDDPGGAQNCQGSVAGNDVVVGANAVTSYANIAAGASANICDFTAGQASPMFCVVRK